MPSTWNVWVLMLTLLGGGWSGPDEAGDGRGCLGDLGIGLVATDLDGLGDAVAQMLVEEDQVGRLAGHGREASESFDHRLRELAGAERAAEVAEGTLRDVYERVGFAPPSTR